jgi:hypothetical protein
MRVGILFAIVAAITAGVLAVARTPRTWRAVLVAPLVLAALGFFQAHEKT